MKKALLVTRVSGFVPQHEMNDVRILQEMGYEIHYATNYHQVVYGKDNSRLDGTGILRHQIDFDRSPFSGRLRGAKGQLEELMLAEDFDLIHCHMPMSAAITRVVAEKIRKKTGKNIPVLYTAHGFHFSKDAPLVNWFYYPVERYLARYTDRLILMNQEDYKRALHFKLRGKLEKINGVGIDLKRFAAFQKASWDILPAGADGFSVRERYHIPFDHYLLVTVGEMTPRKNHRVIIDALKECRDLKLSYLICGEGPCYAELKKQTEQAGLADRVIFAGYVDEPLPVLQQCDCCVFPSFREGLPVALMEAMAVGLPVITSDVRGMCDLQEHGKGGYMVHGFAPEDYAVKLRRMFEERSANSRVPRVLRREQMGRWNLERIKDFSLEVVDRQMRRIYHEVEEERKKEDG